MTPIRTLPNGIDFLRWVGSRWNRQIGFGIGIIYMFVGLYSNNLLGNVKIGTPGTIFGDLLNSKSIAAPSFFQFVVLAPLIVACAMTSLPQWLLDRRNSNESAIKSCEQFRWAQAGLVCTWFAFYVLVFFDQWKGRSPSARDPWIDFFNNFQGVFLFASYWVLTSKTIPNTKNDSQEPKAQSLPLWAVYLFLLWAAFIFLVADIHFSAIPASEDFRSVFQLFSGLWVGVALALLVGCLERQYFGQPRWVAFPLYFYAALQVSYVGFFSSKSSLEIFATITSLPLKLLFIGFWAWVLENGLLAFYMQRARKDFDEVPKQWTDFRAPETAKAAGQP